MSAIYWSSLAWPDHFSSHGAYRLEIISAYARLILISAIIGGKIDLEVPWASQEWREERICEVLDAPGYSIKQNSIAAYSS